MARDGKKEGETNFSMRGGKIFFMIIKQYEKMVPTGGNFNTLEEGSYLWLGVERVGAS